MALHLKKSTSEPFKGTSKDMAEVAKKLIGSLTD